MQPFPLETARFVLDQPVAADIDDIVEYCSDPVFKAYMATPWPYRRQDAVFFVDDYVPGGWAGNSEWTWAIRDHAGARLMGVVGVRIATGMVGYWLGAPHRGRGVMTESLGAVVSTVFARTEIHELRWECVVGNCASMRVAQKTGFRFAGQRLGAIQGRDGQRTESWTGDLRRHDDRDPVSGWPG